METRPAALSEVAHSLSGFVMLRDRGPTGQQSIYGIGVAFSNIAVMLEHTFFELEKGEFK